ncbi:DUF924 family protein [Streptococcus moroccensis]|uniref:Uncharacterized protein (DUF924 family) n=1 Tax=Streptococcus moroccensis TaxID=1451356 RepID=A0ABT9YSK9_9STRE|nr:DUF924 family protein [Streptococcus moroccensis]MDQ0222591.1 uncharacterized protein (DUF924 family) [Streptococcus moroccensis]
MVVKPNDVLNFWFSPENKKLHFAKSKVFDQKIKELFLKTWEAGQSGELFSWRSTLHGRVAEIIVLDQFSRNLFRDSKESFTQDPMALVLAQETVKQEGFWELDKDLQLSALMPFMHSESRVIHEEAVLLFQKVGDVKKLFYEEKHKEIIDRFDRYPHRNAILERVSTAEEKSYLTQENPNF